MVWVFINIEITLSYNDNNLVLLLNDIIILTEKFKLYGIG